MNFETRFFQTQEAINEVRKTLIVKRLMDVQRRAKIKPSVMNPVLLNSSRSPHQNVQVNGTPTE